MIEASEQFSLTEIFNSLENNEHILIKPFFKVITKKNALALLKHVLQNYSCGKSTPIGCFALTEDNSNQNSEKFYEFYDGQAQFMTLALLKKCYMDMLYVNIEKNSNQYTAKYESIMNQMGKYSLSGYHPLFYSKDKTDDAEICTIFNWKPSSKEDLYSKDIKTFATIIGISDTSSVVLENYYELLQVVSELIDDGTLSLDTFGELLDSMTVSLTVTAGPISYFYK